MDVSEPAFARDAATAAYYDRRAAEYDEWYESAGRFRLRERAGWSAEVERLVGFVRDLPTARTLDVACGTGYLTRHLSGSVVGVDQSRAMVAIARSRLDSGTALVADALRLPFGDGAFDRVLTGHFYGHLSHSEREAFRTEAFRVGRELLVVDAAVRPEQPVEQMQERVLNDGSRHVVYKRYFEAEHLAAELGGRVLFGGDWFVAVEVAG